MGTRMELHALLLNLIENGNVYFQEPSSLQMQYPCIIYKRDDINTVFANNGPYKNKKRYQVTVVDKNPDSEIPDKVSQLPLCSFDRFFTADNLNHDVFNLYF
jgi:hypothetical protein